MMILADGWRASEYAVLEAGDGMKIERWGNEGVVLKRPDPQAIWSLSDNGKAIKPHATYLRSQTGGGHWEFKKRLPDAWNVHYQRLGLTFIVRPTGFKHTGLFPEQAANWEKVTDICKKAHKPLNVLNLFAYTGGATLALAAAGASVTHVDAAKSMVAWAKDNAQASGLQNAPIRYIVDDCLKFVLREQRRGKKYDGIIMDPPSYGRGPDGQMWKIETSLYPLVEECAKILTPDARFFFINSYTTGLASRVIASILYRAIDIPARGGRLEADELCLPISGSDEYCLPCGSTGRWIME